MPLPSNGSMDQCVSRLNRNQEHDGADLITQLRIEVDAQTERADELADECELLKIMNREGVRALAKLKASEDRELQTAIDASGDESAFVVAYRDRMDRAEALAENYRQQLAAIFRFASSIIRGDEP